MLTRCEPPLPNYAGVEVILPDIGPPAYSALAIAPFDRICAQAKAEPICPEQARSRTARPDTPSGEVPRQMVIKYAQESAVNQRLPSLGAETRRRAFGGL